jgi:hypothetical protein
MRSKVIQEDALTKLPVKKGCSPKRSFGDGKGGNLRIQKREESRISRWTRMSF